MRIEKSRMLARYGSGRRVAGTLVMGAAGLLAGMGMPVSTAQGAIARRAVLEVEVRIDSGHERWKNGPEWKEGAFSQFWTLNIPYVAAEGLDNFNPYDSAHDAQSCWAGQSCEPGGSDSDPGFAEPSEDRFQRWEMTEPCGATIVADYKYEAHERLNDVTGPAEGMETAIGDAEGAVVSSQMPITCSSNQIVTDIKTRKLYVQSFYMPMIPVHQSIRSKPLSKPLEGDVPGGLPGGADMPTRRTVTQWITERLKGAPQAGHAEKAFKVKGNMNGISRVTNPSGKQEIAPDASDPQAWKRQVPNFHETGFIVKLTWQFRELRT